MLYDKFFKVISNEIIIFTIISYDAKSNIPSNSILKIQFHMRLVAVTNDHTSTWLTDSLDVTPIFFMNKFTAKRMRIHVCFSSISTLF